MASSSWSCFWRRRREEEEEEEEDGPEEANVLEEDDDEEEEVWGRRITSSPPSAWSEPLPLPSRYSFSLTWLLSSLARVRISKIRLFVVIVLSFEAELYESSRFERLSWRSSQSEERVEREEEEEEERGVEEDSRRRSTCAS